MGHRRGWAPSVWEENPARRSPTSRKRSGGDGVEQIPAIFLIAVSLALDAFAVAVSCGVSVPGFGKRQALRVALWFGGFQSAMTLGGWRLGSGVSSYIRAVDHWVAFALLFFIGGKMVWESLTKSSRTEKRETVAPELTARRLSMLALATSIDALAVGISMAFLEGMDIRLAAGMIGAVAFALSLMGGVLGRRLGRLFQTRAQLAGGLVLVGMGLHILGEHLGQGFP